MLPTVKRVRSPHSADVWQRMMMKTMRNGPRPNQGEEGKKLIE